MRKISRQYYIIFTAIILFSATAFIFMIYSGARLIFVDRPAEQESRIGGKECVAFSALNGVCLVKGETEKYPVAVMIDNKKESWPPSGLSYAGLVFEAPVEGGITRFLAVYTTDKEIKKIGPVRSIRPYYIDWAKEFGALMMHIGGSPAALDKIANDALLRERNIDGQGEYFWRAKNRFAPHNTYTSSKLLDTAREKILHDSDWQNLKFDSWEFKNDDFASERGDNKMLTIKFSNDTLYNAVWEYDRDKNEYRRKIGNDYAKDEDGRLILAKNIAVLATEIEIIDEISRRDIKTISNGDALVFLDGKRVEARWEKRSAEDRVFFFDLNGKPIQFNRGVTWVEVTGDLGQVAKN